MFKQEACTQTKASIVYMFIWSVFKKILGTVDLFVLASLPNKLLLEMSLFTFNVKSFIKFSTRGLHCMSIIVSPRLSTTFPASFLAQ